MSCILFVPQIQIPSGIWMDFGKPCKTYEEADQAKVITTKPFRVLQTSCEDKPIKKGCCSK